MSRPITERMAEARRQMIERRKRVPRVFYLARPAYAEFAALKPPTVEAMFALPLGSKPQPMTCLGFEGLPVRESTAKQRPDGTWSSKLISCCGISVSIKAE